MDVVNVMDMAAGAADPDTGTPGTSRTTNPAGSATRTRKGVRR